MASKMSIDDLRYMLSMAAELVALYGEAHLPVFEMLEREVAEAEARTDAVERARRIARARQQTVQHADGVGRRTLA